MDLFCRLNKAKHSYVGTVHDANVNQSCRLNKAKQSYVATVHDANVHQFCRLNKAKQSYVATVHDSNTHSFRFESDQCTLRTLLTLTPTQTLANLHN